MRLPLCFITSQQTLSNPSALPGRLDAMGAIGIARCFTFGGRFGRVLHDPTVPPRAGLTRQQYMDAGFQQTTLNHFHEKLLLLKVGGFAGRAGLVMRLKKISQARMLLHRA